jgi:threonine synthase
MNKLICKKCSSVFSINDKRWQCDCGYMLDIDFQPVLELEKIASRKPTMWRYREAIPIKDDANIISFDEGFTPLTEIDLEGRRILIKQDHLFPTGSYKDRGASVLISKAKEIRVARVVEDSSGNAGCAIAAYCAKAGIGCEIFVPAGTSAGKVAQIQYYGAKLNRIPGTREDTAAAVLKAAAKDYYASHSWNPFFFHGTKTFAFEVCEQLGWKAPDSIVLPVGNGTLLLGCYIGFEELLNAGIIEIMPKLIAIQSAHCAPLYEAFVNNLDSLPQIEKGETIAEGIAIAEPIRGMQIIEAVRNSGGRFIAVDDSEIEESLKEICARGFYIEPTSAATIAGLKSYLAESNSDEVVVSVFTGHGLKTTETMVKMLDG